MNALDIDWNCSCHGWQVGAVSRRGRFATALGAQRATAWLSKTPVVIVLVRPGEVVAIKPCGTSMTEQELKALNPDIAEQIRSRA
jgi:hypothetical protein